MDDGITGMTKKVKIFLAILLIASIAGMGYSFHDTAAIRKIAGTVQNIGRTSAAQQSTVDLTAPHYIIAGDGTYEYTITDRNLNLPEDIVINGASDDTEYASYLAALKTIFSAGNAPEQVDEEAETTIRESFSKYSMTAVFEYDVPLAEYLKFNNINSRTAEQLPGISRMTIFSDGSAALYNRHTGDYYRIAAASQEENALQQNLEKLMQYVFENPGTDNRMQSITSMTGVENSALIPEGAQITVGSTPFVSEFRSDQPEDQERVKKVFFPDGMDFVNTIKKADGSTILMYGSGKDVLKFGNDGKVSNFAELQTEEYRKCGLYESLKNAAAFLESENWKTEEMDQLNLFVKEVSQISERNCSGYRIEVGASFHGMEVMYENDSLLTMEIFGKQITSCIRNLPDLRGAAIPAEPAGAMDGTDLIRQNSDTVAAVILDLCSDDSSVNTEKYSANDNFYAVASSIIDARLTLVRLEDASTAAANAGEQPDNGGGNPAGAAENADNGGASLCIPAWYLLVDGVEFWFNAENGNLLSYGKK